jgi:hypothetical protein
VAVRVAVPELVGVKRPALLIEPIEEGETDQVTAEL